MKLLFLIAIFIFSPILHAENIAYCTNPKGKTYYPELGSMPKKHAGWEENDKITGGITKLVKISKNIYDIVFVDAFKKEISSIQDGGKVILLNRGKNVVSFLVVYLGKTAEVFTFLKNNSGKLEFILTTSRAGSGIRIAKSSLMRGDCNYINFDKL